MRRHVLVLVGIGLGCAALAWGAASLAGRGRPADALAAAPEGASIVAQVELPALLASPLWRALGEGDAGMQRIRQTCGFDPVESIRTVEVFVVGSEERPFERVGFVARGELDPERLAECVQRVVTEDGGSLRRVDIEGVPAIASQRGPSRAAFLGTDAVVGGDELVVREAIRVDRGLSRGAGGDPVLARMWRRSRARRELSIAARLPPNWRDWLGRVGQSAELDALEEVRSLGIGARIRSGLGLTVALGTGSPERALAIGAGLRARLAEALDHPFLQLTPAGAALRRIDVDVDGEDVLATVDLDEDLLSSVIALAREALASRAVDPGPSSPTPALDPLEPDERLEPGAPPEAP